MGMKLLMSTAFHLQMDGSTQWANRSVAQILQTVLDNDQKKWSEKCSMVKFTINSSVNTTTSYAPFELNYGYMLQSGQHISTNTMLKGGNASALLKWTSETWCHIPRKWLGILINQESGLSQRMSKEIHAQVLRTLQGPQSDEWFIKCNHRATTWVQR